MATEPIGHTCPTIDKYIKSIKSVLLRSNDIRRIDADDYLYHIEQMNDELSNCIDYLEDLRSSNDKLRQWGQSESERADELEKELNNITV
jgi:hypothetical protein